MEYRHAVSYDRVILIGQSMPLEQPSLYHAADALSARSQAAYLLLHKAQLAILFACALAGGFGPYDLGLARIVAISIAAAMFVALFFSVLLKVMGYDDRWFRARALAENIKSLSWAFSTVVVAANSEREYVSQVNELTERLPQLAKHLHTGNESCTFTKSIHERRALPLDQRFSLYVAERIGDQQKWYANKAKENAQKETLWFIILIALEFLAIAAAAFQAWALWQFNLTSGVVALASVGIAWSQTKRFSDLANSYGVAADDLRGIRDANSTVSSDEQLAELVRAAENAISREHSMWVARRLPY
jgi:hypothetical protein